MTITSAISLSISFFVFLAGTADSQSLDWNILLPSLIGSAIIITFILLVWLEQVIEKYYEEWCKKHKTESRSIVKWTLRLFSVMSAVYYILALAHNYHFPIDDAYGFLMRIFFS